MTDPENSEHQVATTTFCGRVGDHNDRAMLGARVLGTALAARLGRQAVTVGTPEPALNTGWEEELRAAAPNLTAMASRYEEIFTANRSPLTMMTRCAVALATLPVVARYRPDAMVLWFDAHADLNTPGNTTPGYLGGLAFAGPLGLWNSGFGDGVCADHAVLCGSRDIDPPETALIEAGVIKHVKVGPAMPDELRQIIGKSPVYVHIDCDVLEPGIVPTDYHVPGGMTLDDLHAVSASLAAGEVVGLELAEYEAGTTDDGRPHSPTDLFDALQPLLDRVGESATRRL